MLKKCVVFVFGLFTFMGLTNAQAQNRYFSQNATINFDAEGTLDDFEEIRAKNTQGSFVYDAATGAFEWQVSIKDFVFANKLMQQHFNENYMETEKYPKASFKGKIEDFKTLNLSKDGNYTASVKGVMTLHGVNKEISTKGEFEVKNGKISSKSNFVIALADYNIKVPTLMMMKIAEVVKVQVSTDWQVLKK